MSAVGTKHKLPLVQLSGQNERIRNLIELWLVDHLIARGRDRNEICISLYQPHLRLDNIFLPAIINSVSDQHLRSGNYILDVPDSESYEMEDRPVLSEIEITPEMIEAGVEALCLFKPSEDDLDMIVEAIFRSMSISGLVAP